VTELSDTAVLCSDDVELLIWKMLEVRGGAGKGAIDIAATLNPSTACVFTFADYFFSKDVGAVWSACSRELHKC
jgi:hypothetical protein